MPIFAKYLVIFENKNRDSYVVRVFYNRQTTNGESRQPPIPAIKRMAAAKIPVEEYLQFNNYSVEGLEKEPRDKPLRVGCKLSEPCFVRLSPFLFLSCNVVD